MEVAIEHDRTRQRLKHAFERLFDKYDKNFSEDDEIDIVNLQIVKRGRTLRKMRSVEIGDAYHHRHRKSKKRRKRSQNLEYHQLSNARPKKPKRDNTLLIEERFKTVNQRLMQKSPFEQALDECLCIAYPIIVPISECCHCQRADCYECVLKSFC
jgi:hypothetical protein